MKKKVIIIGAGPAGLTAGYELLKRSKDYEVTILEASDSIGGISKTVNYKGNRMDIGGHRFFSKDQDVNDFWEEILPLQGKPSFDDKKLHRKKKLAENGPNPEKEDKVMLVRNRVSRIYYLKKFFDYPVSMKWETFKNMGFIRTMQSGFSYLKTIIYKRKETNLENFYINRFGKKLYSMFFEKYTEKLWGRHPSNISADWGSQRVKGLSIIAVIKDTASKIFHVNNKKKETSLIEEYKYPKYGPGELWEEVASKIESMGGKVLMHHEVIKIKKDSHKIISITCNVNGKQKEIDGDIFISSMPIKDLINGMNNVPKEITDIGTNLPYRDFVTVGLLVKKLNLKNETNIKTLNNIVPDCWIYIQEPDVKLGRIQVFNNWSPYMVKDPNNTVWLGLEYFCNENDKFWNMEDKERIKFATKELIKMGIIDKEDVLDAHVEKVKKAYPAYFDTYKDIDKVIEYLNTLDNLYCVGRNGQHRYNNMDHSMVTSFKTVDHIINNIENKDEIWNVNTETDYHEETKEDNILKRTYNKIKDYFKEHPITKIEAMLLFLIPILVICWKGFFIDNDSWMFLNHGRYVLNHGIPYTEPFTMHSNLEFVMQQWLYSVIYYFIKTKLGWIGISITFLFIGILFVFFLYKLCMLISNKRYLLSTIITIFISCILIKKTFFTTRPQMVSYLIFIILIYNIEKYFKEGKLRYLFMIPLLSLIEINMHASMWWFLFLFIVPFILEAFIDKYYFKKELNYSVEWFIIFICLALAAGFINPYGSKAISYFFGSFNPFVSELVIEMKTPSITSKVGLFIMIILFIRFIIIIKEYSDKKYIRTSYLFLLFGTLILALSNFKSTAYYYIFALYPLAYYFKADEEVKYIKKSMPSYRVLICLLFTCSLIGLSYYYGRGRVLYKNITEHVKYELDYIEENYNKEDVILFIDYDHGCEAEYRGFKTYIDARAEVFYRTLNKKENIFNEYYSMYTNGLSLSRINEIFAERNFTHILINVKDSLYLYDEFENYTLVKEPEGFKLYVRNDLLKE